MDGTEPQWILTQLELSAGTLDQMVDQVTQSIAFVQKRYPCNEWVSLRVLLLSDDAGWEDRGFSPLDAAQLPFLACGAEGKLGLLDTGLMLWGN